MTSSAYVTCTNAGKTSTWHFTGVVSVEHNLALNLSNTESEGADIINGARNLPNQVTLNVLELDTEHSAGWSAAMLSVMGRKEVTGGHDILVNADALIEDPINIEETDMIVLPGGMGGRNNMAASKPLADLLYAFKEKGKRKL